MRKERRYALPAQNDLHSVENFFTLDEDNLFPLHTHQGRMKNLLRVVATSIFPMSHNGLVRSRPLQRCLTRSTMPEDGQKGTIAHKAASHTCRESVGSLGNSISPTNMSLQLCKQPVAGIAVIPNEVLVMVVIYSKMPKPHHGHHQHQLTKDYFGCQEPPCPL